MIKIKEEKTFFIIKKKKRKENTMITYTHNIY